MHEKHVPDLEHCQELDRLCKEKNITIPETEFYWYKLLRGTWTLQDMCWCDAGYVLRIPAPLVSELGEWFPEYLMIRGKRYLPKQQQVGVRRYYSYEYDEFNLIIQGGKGEPNARQKMLNYLIAEGIITTL